eukprot:g81889.t1
MFVGNAGAMFVWLLLSRLDWRSGLASAAQQPPAYIHPWLQFVSAADKKLLTVGSETVEELDPGLSVKFYHTKFAVMVKEGDSPDYAQGINVWRQRYADSGLASELWFYIEAEMISASPRDSPVLLYHEDQEEGSYVGVGTPSSKPTYWRRVPAEVTDNNPSAFRLESGTAPGLFLTAVPEEDTLIVSAAKGPHSLWQDRIADKTKKLRSEWVHLQFADGTAAGDFLSSPRSDVVTSENGRFPKPSQHSMWRYRPGKGTDCFRLQQFEARFRLGVDKEGIRGQPVMSVDAGAAMVLHRLQDGTLVTRPATDFEPGQLWSRSSLDQTRFQLQTCASPAGREVPGTLACGPRGCIVQAHHTFFEPAVSSFLREIPSLNWPLMPYQDGAQPYRYMAQLGKGEEGVAMKVARPIDALSAQEEEFVLKVDCTGDPVYELANMQLLGEHPHIPSLLHHYSEGPCHYMEVEMVPDPLPWGHISLTIWPDMLPIDQVYLAKELWGMVAYFAEKQFVHCDLHPFNVLLSKKGQNGLWIIDQSEGIQLNLPARNDSGPPYCPSCQLIRPYCPPERLAHPGRECQGFGDDVYTSSMLMAELLLGEILTNVDWASPKKTRFYELLVNSVVKANKRLGELVVWGLEKDHKRRPTAQQLHKAASSLYEEELQKLKRDKAWRPKSELRL